METYFEPKDFPKITKVAFKSLNPTRVVIYVLAGFLSLGVIWILSFWFDKITEFMYTDEAELMRAEFVMFTKDTGSNQYMHLRKQRCRLLPSKSERFYMFFFFEGCTFYFSNKRMKFKSVKNLYMAHIQAKQPPLEDLSKGLDKETLVSLHKLYGTNKISLHGKTLPRYFVTQIFFPANFFQLCISISFFFIGRVLYSVMVFCYVMALVAFKTYEYAQKVSKFKAVSKCRDFVTVSRRRKNGQLVEKQIHAYELCLGDIMHVEPEQKFPCDLLLIEGSSLVNEAMLTGESTPLLKIAVESKNLKSIEPKHLLYSGTFSIFNKTKTVKGLVIATGWNTTKGEMLNTIAFHEDRMLRFDRDFFLVLAYLFLINIALLVTLIAWELYRNTFGWQKDGVKILQFLKNGFPPSLYFITIASMQMSAYKLTKQDIRVLHMEKIVEGGGITTVAFDKTGTLTENSLYMFGFSICQEAAFSPCHTDLRNLVFYASFREFLETISCCHSLIAFNDKLYGDPLEDVMFKASKSQMLIEESSDGKYFETRIGFAKEFKQMFKFQSEFPMRIVKINEFSSSRRKMSVVTHNEETDELTLLVKGAPESIKEVCKPETIPPNYDQILVKYSEQGYRIIALAYKRLKSSNFTIDQSRIIIHHPDELAHEQGNVQITQDVIKEIADKEPEQMESELIFIGLLLFENPIKPTTADTIAELKKNYMNLFVITGDNVYTAVNVAYTSGLIEANQNIIIGSINTQTHKVQLQEFHADERIELSKRPRMDNIDWEFSAVSAYTPASNRRIKAASTLDQIIKICLEDKKKIALEAKCFDYLHKLLKEDDARLRRLMDNIVVYGRATTEQKEIIVEVYKSLLQKQNQCIAFVGDGSNDCRALKAANVGLSIGNDESSFAASFTSTRSNISPIIDVIIEGKACLANAVQNFKYLMISNLMVCFGIYLLNFKMLAFNQFDYLYSFIFSLPFALFMTLGRSKKKLNCLRMEPTLLTRKNLGPFIMHLVLIFIFLGYAVLLLSTFQVYKTVEEVIGVYDPKTFDVDQHFFVENKLIFFFMSTMMIVNATACYAGFPFKVSFLKNPFVVLYSFLTVLFILFNIFAESILEGQLLEFYVRRGRQPIYQPRQLKKFWLVSGLAYFVIIFLNTIVDRVNYYKQLKYVKTNKRIEIVANGDSEVVINTKLDDLTI